MIRSADYKVSHAMLRVAMAIHWFWAADKLINRCPLDGGECWRCGEICCPHKDQMHFHHDGCPSCCIARNEEQGT
jgi:hypothetical protein